MHPVRIGLGVGTLRGCMKGAMAWRFQPPCLEAGPAIPMYAGARRAAGAQKKPAEIAICVAAAPRHGACSCRAVTRTTEETAPDRPAPLRAQRPAPPSEETMLSRRALPILALVTAAAL